MNSEIADFSHYLHEKINAILAALKPLSEEELNSAPEIPGANPPFVIATHTYGNIRAWVIGIACGRPLSRDRPAEFRSSGTYDDLAAAARRLSADIDTALEQLDPGTLDDRFTPSQELFGEGPTHEVSRRGALIHPLEHAAIHLGHIQMTVDLLRVGK
jgi:hypothetical protein